MQELFVSYEILSVSVVMSCLKNYSSSDANYLDKFHNIMLSSKVIVEWDPASVGHPAGVGTAMVKAFAY